MDSIGFMGMGAMGVPMATNLALAGLEVTVCNRTAGKCAPAQEAGARRAESFMELAQGADIVILMLSGPEAIENTLGELLRERPDTLRGKLVVNMGTNPPAYMRALAQRVEEAGANLVDAPVLGTQEPAQQGHLVILASGPQAFLARLTPAFQAMGRAVVQCGEVPGATTMKLALNLVMSTALEGMLEGAHFAQKAGLDLGAFFDLVQQGPVGNSVFGLKIPKLLAKDFTPQASLSTVREMLEHIVETAREVEAYIPGTLNNLDLTNSALQQGLGSQDACALIKVFGRMPAGIMDDRTG